MTSAVSTGSATPEGSTVPRLAPTLSNDLERVRLEHRARRLELVVSVLRERARLSAGSAQAPLALQQSITDFAAELRETHRALRRAHSMSARVRGAQ